MLRRAICLLVSKVLLREAAARSILSNVLNIFTQLFNGVLRPRRLRIDLGEVLTAVSPTQVVLFHGTVLLLFVFFAFWILG